MNAPLRRFNVEFPLPRMERLEARRLLSAAIATASLGTTGVVGAADTTATSSTVVLTGVSIHAQTNQFFRAVVGTIRNLPAVPTAYRFRGSINWGDGKPNTYATFARQTDGSIAVIGAHTYTAVGTDDITVTIIAVPPPWSAAPVQLIGTFHSSATVFAPDGGVTLEETVSVHFTARVGFFRSTISSSMLTATIDWGDGQQSTGKIVALPTADPLAAGLFAVVGDHTYTASASYLVHTTVYQLTPIATAPPTVVVAKFESVVDVLPVSPIAALVPGDSNGDGVVDVADLGTLASDFGTTTEATWDMGDFNGDGAVDVTDLGDLASKFGEVASWEPTASTAPTASAAVPANALPATVTTTTPALALNDADVSLASRIDHLFSAVPVAHDS